jgi:hypothetical protein
MKAIDLLALLLVGVQAPALVGQADVPRLSVKLEQARPGVVRFTVTNVVRKAVAVRAQAYAVLIGASPEGGDQPEYWSELKVTGLPTSDSPLRLLAAQTASGELELTILQWARNRNGMFAERPMPGEYRLQLRIKDLRNSWWRSNVLPANVRRSGSFK